MKRKLMQRVLIASAALSLWTGISYANVPPEDMDYASKPKVVSEVAKEAMKKFLEGKFSELNQEEKNWLSQNLARHYISFDHSDNEDPMLNWDNAGATGRRSMSIGKGAFSKGVESISIGNGAGSLGDHSIALGINSRARDTHSIAIGQGANAKKFGAVAIGSQTNALGESSLVVGGGTAAEDYSIAMAGGKALAKHSFAFGIDSQVAKDAKESIAIGRDSIAKQKLSLSIGHFAKSDGILNSVIGYDATGSGQGATVLGGYGESGENSTAIGLNAKALGNMST
ncbi:hypothetical protein, partial [Dialister micraerophilus]|uniref:hypothetical protein n=1 Tax=Dialister micraerophilus TaxID=309120 RepID=UPI0023F05B27